MKFMMLVSHINNRTSTLLISGCKEKLVVVHVILGTSIPVGEYFGFSQESYVILESPHASNAWSLRLSEAGGSSLD